MAESRSMMQRCRQLAAESTECYLLREIGEKTTTTEFLSQHFFKGQINYTFFAEDKKSTFEFLSGGLVLVEIYGRTNANEFHPTGHIKASDYNRNIFFSLVIFGLACCLFWQKSRGREAQVGPDLEPLVAGAQRGSEPEYDERTNLREDDIPKACLANGFPFCQYFDGTKRVIKIAAVGVKDDHVFVSKSDAEETFTVKLIRMGSPGVKYETWEKTFDLASYEEFTTPQRLVYQEYGFVYVEIKAIVTSPDLGVACHTDTNEIIAEGFPYCQYHDGLQSVIKIAAIGVKEDNVSVVGGNESVTVTLHRSDDHGVRGETWEHVFDLASNKLFNNPYRLLRVDRNKKDGFIHVVSDTVAPISVFRPVVPNIGTTSEDDTWVPEDIPEDGDSAFGNAGTGTVDGRSAASSMSLQSSAATTSTQSRNRAPGDENLQRERAVNQLLDGFIAARQL
jgi:hypothetical protein